MIGAVVDAVRERVALPQETAADPERRAWLDVARADLHAATCTLELFGITSTPIRPEIGRGFVTLRHIVAVVLSVEDVDVDAATARRDPIVADLVGRVLRTDWTNVPISTAGVDQDIVTVDVAIEYADIRQGGAAAYATVTLTVDAEWRP